MGRRQGTIGTRNEREEILNNEHAGKTPGGMKTESHSNAIMEDKVEQEEVFNVDCSRFSKNLTPAKTNSPASQCTHHQSVDHLPLVDHQVFRRQT